MSNKDNLHTNQQNTSQQHQTVLIYPQGDLPSYHNSVSQNHTSDSNGSQTFYGSVVGYSNNTPVLLERQPLFIQPLTALKDKTEIVQCPFCKEIIYTYLSHEINIIGYIICVSIFYFAFAGSRSVPFYAIFAFIFCSLPWFKNITHECPACSKKVAEYKSLERTTVIDVPPISQS